MVNIFQHYNRSENQFTNGLFSLFRAARRDDPQFVRSLLAREFDLDPSGDVTCCLVNQGADGCADGRLTNSLCWILLETKLSSGSLSGEQVSSLLESLSKRPEPLKRLVMLTPDDSASSYTQGHLSCFPELLRHVSWRSLYEHLEEYAAVRTPSVFTDLVCQFLEMIREAIFEKDIVAILYPANVDNRDDAIAGCYLKELVTGERTGWKTRQYFDKLDGTGRKLLLYDRSLGGITAEGEVVEVERADSSPRPLWWNRFGLGTVRRFEPPISDQRVRRVKGLEGFGAHPKERRVVRNITYDQYRRLVRA